MEVCVMLDNRRRVYCLAQFTVEKKASGWFYRRTDYDEPAKGPYASETSVCLMLARALKKELLKRDGLPN
jgi:hypothetical protein